MCTANIHISSHKFACNTVELNTPSWAVIFVGYPIFTSLSLQHASENS